MRGFAWRAFVVALVFAIVFGFIPILPWGGLCFLWRMPMWRLFHLCVVALIFATVFCFVPLFPWALIGAELLVIWGCRLSLRAQPIRGEMHDAFEGDVYVVGEVPRGYLERGYPGGRWLVKRSAQRPVGRRPA
jgi:hypothetical protein